jgi:thymidylate synthase (FAD)
MIEVHPPHGYVDLTRHDAADLHVVNAARASFVQESGDIGDYERGLINYLLRNRHGSPFEHTSFTFTVRAPIFVLREWHRHRVGISINEESGRYKKLETDFYTPDYGHVRTQKGKPGSYEFHPMGIIDATAAVTKIEQAQRVAAQTYEELLEMGVAKELARTVLPVSTYSTMVWSCNARSLMNFLSLRNAPDAMREIREYAEALESYFAETMPITHAAFVANDRIAP